MITDDMDGWSDSMERESWSTKGSLVKGSYIWENMMLILAEDVGKMKHWTYPAIVSSQNTDAPDWALYREEV